MMTNDPEEPATMETVDSGAPDSNSVENNQSATKGSPQQEESNDDEGPTSSAENILPLDKLKNGWLTMGSYLSSAAKTVQDKAVETYNSESVTNIKRRTSEVITPAWEKTCEIAAPIWESTCTTASYAVEKTKEGAVIAKEKVGSCEGLSFLLVV
jgi:hypothetical protein